MMYQHLDVACEFCGAVHKWSVKMHITSAGTLAIHPEMSDTLYCVTCGNRLNDLTEPHRIVSGQQVAINDLWMEHEFNDLRSAIANQNQTITNLILRNEALEVALEKMAEMNRRRFILSL